MADDKTIDESIATLVSGGTILYPTETIWGLGCDPESKKAVAKIFEIKKRPITMPLLLLVSNIDMLKELVGDINPRLDKLIHYSDRPVSVIYPFGHTHPFADGIVESEKKTLCVRLVKKGFAHQLVEAYGKPIVSTSANISGEPFPTKIEQISPSIHETVDYTVYSEEEMTGEPSRIVKIDPKGKEIIFIR